MNSSIEIVMRKIGELKPYENNPRHNDMAVDAVAASIQQFGFKNPVIIDKDGVIVAGHTRYKAAKKLGITDIPCISADDLSDEQIKAFRLADNKTAELAEWDEDLLGKEMQGIINIDMSQFGFSVGEDELGEEMQDDKYTLKVKIPQYEITGECPEISDMLDSSKAEEYKKNFGADRVIIFDKQAAYDRADTMDNFNDHRAIIYARNECWRIAEELGLKYFLMLDDDYKSIDYRYEEDGKLKYKPSHDFDRVFEDMIQFLEVSGADTVAFCQGGDFVGGVDGGNFHKGLLRKAMNSFFCKTDTPIEYRGTMNEDVVTYTTLSSRGHLFFSNTQYCVVQLPTQSLSGGMTDAYKEGGTYLKTFYAIMSMPSAVKVSMMYTTHKRIHHRINWEHTAPKILNEKWRKERKEDT